MNLLYNLTLKHVLQLQVRSTWAYKNDYESETILFVILFTFKPYKKTPIEPFHPLKAQVNLEVDMK